MKIKKIQLITALLFILTILLMLIGLLLINLFNEKEVVFTKNYSSNKDTKKPLIFIYNGFKLWSKNSWYYILTNDNISLKNFGNYYIIHNYYHYSLLQFKIGVIFWAILVPMFLSIILSLIFLIIGLKIKIKNNNFWDALQNCEIINNYYIH